MGLDAYQGGLPFGAIGHPHDLPVPTPSLTSLTEEDVRRIAREEISKSIERMVTFAERLDDPSHPEGSVTTSDDGGNW